MVAERAYIVIPFLLGMIPETMDFDGVSDQNEVLLTPFLFFKEGKEWKH